MKRISLFIFTIALSILFINKLDAIPGYTTDVNLTIRTEPRVADETFVYQIPSRGFELNVVSEELYNIGDKNCEVGWYKINYQGQERYVCGKWVSLGNTPDDNPSYNEETYEARVYGYSIQVRQEPNSNSPLKEKLLTGTNLIILGDKVSGYGCTSGWYKVKYHKNSEGYICSTYVRKKEELTASNPTYEQELRTAGWPETYIPYLTKLHEQHPNWKFNLRKIDIDWEYLVSMESNQNVLHKDFISDTVREVYSKGTYKENDYDYATDGVTAFVLDPRNFLAEKLVFMFESLGYNYRSDDRNNFNIDSVSSKNYFTTLTSMLGNSFLNTDHYKETYIKSGFTYKVSPIHLVGRTIQEGASNETYAAVTGNSGHKYGQYELNGYYNFYNIGSKKDSVTESPVTRGLAFACGSACGFPGNNSYNRPWDTREKAIAGGAEFISGDYIGVGQDTLYFQKFDTKNFWHQYMTNITAPISEGIDAFLAYQKSGLLDESLEFDIPVYNNMPSVVSLPAVASTVNSLNEIKVDGKIVQNFNPDIIDYIVYVLDSKNSVTIEGIKQDDKSTVTGLGTVLLNGEITNHKIVVTAENGFKKTYNLEIRKAKDATTIEDILGGLSVRVTGDIMNKVSPGTHVSTIEQSVAKVSVNASVIVNDNNGNVAPSTDTLKTGYKVRITSPIGETREYKLAVTGDTSGDGEVTILDLLMVRKHIVGSTILSGTNLKAADVNHDGEVTILDLLMVRKNILKEIDF